jgi:hypothetical protein
VIHGLHIHVSHGILFYVTHGVKQAMKRLRGERGTYQLKSNSKRAIRTLRVTNEAWEKFGELAEQVDMTRADLLEAWIENHVSHSEENHVIHGKENKDFDRAIHEKTPSLIGLLEESLKFKANAGGAIKAKVRMAIALLKEK